VIIRPSGHSVGYSETSSVILHPSLLYQQLSIIITITTSTQESTSDVGLVSKCVVEYMELNRYYAGAREYGECHVVYKRTQNTD